MPDRLYLTDSDEANELIAGDPMALLVGLALEQQVSSGLNPIFDHRVADS